MAKTAQKETQKLKLDPKDPDHILRVNDNRIEIYVSPQNVSHSYVKFPVGRWIGNRNIQTVVQGTFYAQKLRNRLPMQENHSNFKCQREILM